MAIKTNTNGPVAGKFVSTKAVESPDIGASARKMTEMLELKRKEAKAESDRIAEEIAREQRAEDRAIRAEERRQEYQIATEERAEERSKTQKEEEDKKAAEKKRAEDIEAAEKQLTEYQEKLYEFNVGNLPMFARSAFRDYQEQMSEELEAMLQEDDFDVNEAIKLINDVSNTYDSISTAIPASVSGNLDLLASLSDPAKLKEYNESLGVNEEVDYNALEYATLKDEVSNNVSVILNEMVPDVTENLQWEFDASRQVFVAGDQEISLTDFTNYLSQNSSKYGPQVKQKYTVDLDTLGESSIRERVKATVGDGGPFDRNLAFDYARKQFEGPSNDTRMQFRIAAVNELMKGGAYGQEEIDEFLSGNWSDENREEFSRIADRAANRIADAAKYEIKTEEDATDATAQREQRELNDARREFREGTTYFPDNNSLAFRTVDLSLPVEVGGDRFITDITNITIDLETGDLIVDGFDSSEAPVVGVTIPRGSDDWGYVSGALQGSSAEYSLEDVMEESFVESVRSVSSPPALP